MFKKKLLISMLICIVFLSFALVNLGVCANNKYPNKPIKVVVPYKPGGRSDLTARILGKYAKEYLGVNFVVVNISGASGTIGCKEVLKAKPDGYTFLYHHQSMFSGYHTGLVNFNFDDFTPACSTVRTINVYIVKADAPWKSFEDLMQYAMDNKGEVKVASSIGSPLHLSFVQMQNATNNSFKLAAGGGGDVDRITKLLGGHFEVTSASLPSVRAYIESGDVRPLVVTSSERSVFLPDVPSWNEVGLPSEFTFDMIPYFPPETPENIIKIFSEGCKKITEDPRYIKDIEDNFIEVKYMDTKECRNFLYEQDALIYRLSKIAGMKPAMIKKEQ